MDDEQLTRTDVELAVADADWRHEVSKLFPFPLDEDAFAPTILKGEAGSMLRRA